MDRLRGWLWVAWLVACERNPCREEVILLSDQARIATVCTEGARVEVVKAAGWSESIVLCRCPTPTGAP